MSDGKSVILVVDDEKPYGKVMREVLEMQGAQVQVAYNASAAETLMQGGIPDLILLDIMMPEKDGLSYLEEIRRDPRFEQVPVIIASAKVTKDIRRKAMEAGANAFLEKPLTIERIKQAISQFVPMG